MNILITGGFLGAGKTTFINYFLNRLSGGSVRAAVLVNEFGEIPVDTVLIEKGSLSIREVTGGCICCSLKGQLFDAVKEIKSSLDPELLIIEATGLAVPSEIAGTVRAAAEGLITELLCVNPAHYKKAAGKLAIYDRQLADAKTVLLTGAGAIDPEAVTAETIISELSARNPEGRLFSDAAEAADYIIETVSAAPAPLHSMAQPRHEHQHHKPDAGSTGGGEVKQDICQVTRRLQSPVNLSALEEEIRLDAERGGEGIFRIKGVVETAEGWQAVQFAEGRMEVKPVPPPTGGESFVVFIGLCDTVKELEL